MGLLALRRFQSNVVSFYYVVQSNAVVEMFANICTFQEPLTIMIAAYLITLFSERVTTAYRWYHKDMKQRITPSNVFLTVAPAIVSSAFLWIHDARQDLAGIFGFTFVSSVLAVLLPIALQRRSTSLGSFFHFTLLFSSLIYRSRSYMWFFILSIFVAFVQFRNESCKRSRIRRRVIIPYLVIAFAGIAISKSSRPSFPITIAGWIGCFAALLLGA